MYSGVHDRIFNMIIPMAVNEGQDVHFALARTAHELGVTYEDYIKLFMHYSSWPSPKSVIDHYNTLNNAKD